jgi:hypothetical protein
VRFTKESYALLPWVYRVVVRFLNRLRVWRVVMVIDEDSVAGQLAVQRDDGPFDGPISELPADMFEHVTPGLRERLQRIGGPR